MRSSDHPPDGANLAQGLAGHSVLEKCDMHLTGQTPSLTEDAGRRLDARPVIDPRQNIMDNWRQSDRRRLGLLSFKAYDNASMNCPTDLWSYQRLFIDQRRDEANLWGSKPAIRAARIDA